MKNSLNEAALPHFNSPGRSCNALVARWGEDIVGIASTNFVPGAQLCPIESLGLNCDTIEKVTCLDSNARSLFIGCNCCCDCFDGKSHSVECLVASIHESSNARSGRFWCLCLIRISYDEWRKSSHSVSRLPYERWKSRIVDTNHGADGRSLSSSRALANHQSHRLRTQVALAYKLHSSADRSSR
jgi:hypothetical protein